MAEEKENPSHQQHRQRSDESENVCYHESMRAPEELHRLKKEELDRRASQSLMYSQQQLWMAAGFLAVTLVTIKQFVPLAQSASPWLAFASMGSFAMTIICSFIAYELANTSWGLDCDCIEIEATHIDGVISEELNGKLKKLEAKRRVLDILTEPFNVLITPFFVFGFIFLGIFLGINYRLIVGA